MLLTQTKKVEPHNQPITHKDFLKHARGSGEKTDMLMRETNSSLKDLSTQTHLRTVTFHTSEIWD